MTQPAVALEGVRKRYRDQEREALAGVDLRIDEGEVVGLLGPNGAGKTTLVKLVCGVTAPTAGRVLVFGRDPVADGGRAKGLLSVVHQSAPLDNMLPVLDNLRIAAAFRGLRWREVRHRVTGLLDAFGLAGAVDQLAFTLSGGQQRRLQVVRALLTVPRLLVLDEPSLGLDVPGRRQVWDLIADLVVEHGTTVLWTSHYLEEIERNCTRVLVVHDGRLVRSAAPARLVDEFGRLSVVLTLPDPVDRERVRPVLAGPGVEVAEDPSGFTVGGPGVQARLPEVLLAVGEAAGRGARVEFRPPSLEDAFVALVEGMPEVRR